MPLTLDPFFFATTTGIPIEKIPGSTSYKKFDLVRCTNARVEIALSSTETHGRLNLLAIEKLEDYSGYLVALLDNITGFIVFRRTTNDRKALKFARSETSTRYCSSLDPEWCLDLDNQFEIPNSFINLLTSRG